jgi:hypothetical protein
MEREFLSFIAQKISALEINGELLTSSRASITFCVDGPCKDD